MTKRPPLRSQLRAPIMVLREPVVVIVLALDVEPAMPMSSRR
jgi:hypothetical protein